MVSWVVEASQFLTRRRGCEGGKYENCLNDGFSISTYCRKSIIVISRVLVDDLCVGVSVP